MQKKDTYVILNKDNFIREILAHDGYFVDQIPPCFSTETLSKAFDDASFYHDLTSTFNVKQIKAYPIELSVYKESILRRTLSFPNILAYIRLIGELQKSFDIYKDLISSENSESKAIMLTALDYPSNYRKSIMRRNIKFSGNKYKLSIDIANCYPSIYSHSIAWALLGKEKAKAMALDAKLQDNLYKKADQIDRANTRLKVSETNGLITGPYSSRIISEIILGGIDKILVSRGYEFTRYVDDYNFYFTNKYDCEKSIGDIAAILNEFNLKINESKLKIEKYPFDILEDYSSLFKQSFNKEYPAYDILQKAALLDQQGKKGSYKYAFKLLRNEPFFRIKKPDEIIYLFYTLISIIINRPMLARYAVEMISKLQVGFSENEMVDKLNDLLDKELDANHDQEVLWLLYVILRYGSKITQSNISKIFVKSNDFAIMMILDLLIDHKEQIVEYEIKQSEIDKLIKKDLVKLENELISETLLSKRWFLIYEINYHKLCPYGLFKNLKISSSTYAKLKSYNVNFYKRIFKK